MKTLARTFLLTGVSLLIGFAAPARPDNDTLRTIPWKGETRVKPSRGWMLWLRLPPGYFRNLTHRPAPEVRLYLPPVPPELATYRRVPPGPAGMPVQDFVFTRFTLARPGKPR